MARQKKERPPREKLMESDEHIFGGSKLSASPEGDDLIASGNPLQNPQGYFPLTEELLEKPPADPQLIVIARVPEGANGFADLIPFEAFDERGYLRLNPDVRQAIDLGHFVSGYAHYVAHGHREGRRLPGDLARRET